MKDKMEVFKSKERKTDLKIGTYFDFFLCQSQLMPTLKE